MRPNHSYRLSAFVKMKAKNGYFGVRDFKSQHIIAQVPFHLIDDEYIDAWDYEREEILFASGASDFVTLFIGYWARVPPAVTRTLSFGSTDDLRQRHSVAGARPSGLLTHAISGGPASACGSCERAQASRGPSASVQPRRGAWSCSPRR